MLHKPLTTGVAGVGKGVDEALLNKERINARVAMAGVLLTFVLELVSGQPLTHYLGL